MPGATCLLKDYGIYAMVDLDGLVEGTETTQKQYSLRFTHNGRISLNKPLSR